MTKAEQIQALNNAIRYLTDMRDRASSPNAWLDVQLSCERRSPLEAGYFESPPYTTTLTREVSIDFIMQASLTYKEQT